MIVDFLLRFHNRLDYYLDLMESSWGYRPKLEISHHWLIRLEALYDPTYPGVSWYRGKRKFFIKQVVSNRTRSPHKIALAIVNQGKAKKAGKGKEPYPTAEAWLADFDKEMSQMVDPTKPEIKIERCRGLYISVNFNIEGFAHKGQTVYVTENNVKTYRKPEAVARMFVAEITSHRNTCGDCGIGVASVGVRAKGYHWQGLEVDVPPDPIEEKIHPLLSKMLIERLEKKGAYPATVCKLRKTNAKSS
jgi:hypothetical protein